MTRHGARTVPEIQADGADVLVLKFAATLAPVAAYERLSGVPPGAIERVLQRIDRLQRIADAVVRS